MKVFKQGITVQLSDPPLIASGHETIGPKSPLAKQWKEDKPGTVIESDLFKGVIVVEDAGGKNHKFRIPAPIKGVKRTSIQFKAPKVGAILGKGDYLYHSTNLTDSGELRLGKNAYTASIT